MKATAKDLRFHSKELLEAVARGEEVLITYRGKPHAKLVPITESPPTHLQDDPAFGLWADNEAVRDVKSFVDELRKSRI